MSGTLCFVETFQTLIVGVLGIFGVIATLIFNSKLSRDLRKDELEHERYSIRQALLTELESLRASFQDRSEKVETDQDWLVPKSVETNIFEAFLPKIGLLSRSETKAVLQAYLLVRETTTRLGMLAKGSDMEGLPEGYFHIKNELVDTARGIHITFLKDIEKAINVLSKEIDI